MNLPAEFKKTVVVDGRGVVGGVPGGDWVRKVLDQHDGIVHLVVAASHP